jgi:hypothetical protein
MYTHKNFKTKKALKEHVAAWNELQALGTLTYMEKHGLLPSQLGSMIGAHPPRPVTYYQPGPFGGSEPKDGRIFVEGPHSPEPHKWYAQCEAKDGVIVKVLK